MEGQTFPQLWARLASAAAAPILGLGSLSCGQQVWRTEEQGIMPGCLLCEHPGIIPGAKTRLSSNHSQPQT